MFIVEITPALLLLLLCLSDGPSTKSRDTEDDANAFAEFVKLFPWLLSSLPMRLFSSCEYKLSFPSVNEDLLVLLGVVVAVLEYS